MGPVHQETEHVARLVMLIQAEIHVCHEVKWSLKLFYLHEKINGIMVFHKNLQYNSK